MTGPFETVTWVSLAAAVLHLLIVFGISIRVLTRRRPPGSTAGWLLLVITLPYGGALLYLLIGERPLGRRRARHFLKGFAGDQINLIMAAAAFNFKKWMREVIFWLQSFIQPKLIMETIFSKHNLLCD